MLPTDAIVFRAANYGTPLRSDAARSEGRFHRASESEPTQYLCMHPLGPLAEFIRRNAPIDEAALRVLRIRTWALRLSMVNLVEIDFDNAEDHDLDPQSLISDTLDDCQDLADDLRTRGIPGIVVPSAALPGTKNVVLFGARISMEYDDDPLSTIDIPSALTNDDGSPPRELIRLVRRRGTPHASFEAWKRRDEFRLATPTFNARSAPPAGAVSG